MDEQSKLLDAKKQLECALGARRFARYWKLAKKVFTRNFHRISFEEFHNKVSPLLTSQTKQLHIQFCLLIMHSCDTLSPITSVIFSTNSHPVHEEEHFSSGKRKMAVIEEVAEGANKRKCLPSRFSRTVLQKPVSTSEMPSEGNSNVALPVSIVHGHVLLTALENDLVLADEEPVKLLFHAARNHLKTIISAVLSRRNAYKLRENKFQYSMGCTSVNTFLSGFHEFHLGKRSVTNSSNAKKLSTNSHRPSVVSPSNALKPPVSTWDLFEALQVHQDVIPNHTLYASSMERITSRFRNDTKVYRQKLHDDSNALN